MGDLVARNLDSLLRELRIRGWHTSVHLSDIAAIIRKRTRVSAEVAHAGVAAGFLSQEGSVFRLTHKALSDSGKRERQSPRFSTAHRIQQGNRSLRSMMATHSATEEEVLRAFGKGTQAALYFDREWLQQNHTYQRLRAAGEL